MTNARIEAIASALPTTEVSNADLERESPTWKMDSVTLRSGVSKRHIANADQTAFDLGKEACLKLVQGGHEFKDINVVIFCTQSPDYLMPGNAHLLHAHFEMPDSVMVFDINLACSGFVYGLAMANSFIQSGLAKKVLLVTADTYSKYINKKDRSARALFGDAAAATLISAAPADGFASFELASHGKEFRKFYVPAGGMRKPKDQNSCLETTDTNGNVKSEENVHMNGLGVWSFINSAVPKQVNQHLTKNKLELRSVDWFIFHQASKMTLDSLIKTLDIAPDKTHSNLADVGNTVSASIPLCLADAIKKQKFRTGDRILLSGFGVGLSYATTSFKYDGKIHVY
jgi:3-oxoacyl-[acyl-carrier-protein] synthase III